MEWKIVGVLQYNVESDRIHQKWVEHFHYWRCSNFKQNINSFLTQMTKRSDCNLYFFRSNNLRDLGTVSQFYSQSTVISKFQNNLHTHYPVIRNMFDVTWRREGEGKVLAVSLEAVRICNLQKAWTCFHVIYITLYCIVVHARN